MAKPAIPIIKIVDIEAVSPSAYNPRETDRRRIEWIKRSLLKLSWLSPVYATVNGEIISGHQRHLSARELGAKKIPIHIVPPMTKDERKFVNILFNRVTNDMKRVESGATMANNLFSEESELLAAGGALPDLDINDESVWPCLKAEMRSMQDLELSNKNLSAFTGQEGVCQKMNSHGIVIAAVVDEDGVLVNGKSRVKVALRNGWSGYPVVCVSKKQAAFAEKMMNWVSMDFSIASKYQDELRYSSFRDVKKANLGMAFTFEMTGVQGRSRDCQLTSPKHRKRWMDIHGRTVLDIGAGRGDDAVKLRNWGVKVTEFEPYRKKEGEPKVSKFASLKIMRSFLEDVASEVQWSSVFQNSVMNSVPFEEDRRKLVQIVAACCSAHTKVYACAASIANPRWKTFASETGYSTHESTASFKADYEPGVTINDLSKKVKMQKFHSRKEWRDLWSVGFKSVDVQEAQGMVFAVCSDPKVEARALAEALDFEFELPYADGTRMGLSKVARSAFSTRLGLDLESTNGG